MANTGAYKTIRLVNHILVIAQLLSIVFLLGIYFFSWDSITIEQLANESGLNLFASIILLGLINLIVPFFGACAIDSKLRLYMKLFSVYVVLNILLNGMMYFYVDKKLLRKFQNAYANMMNNDQSSMSLLKVQHNCTSTSTPDCMTLFSDYLQRSINFLKICILVFIGVNFLMGILVKITLSVKMNKKKLVRPTIVRQQVGFSTNSLRKKKIVLETTPGISEHDIFNVPKPDRNQEDNNQ